MVIYSEKYSGYMYIDLGKNGWEKLFVAFYLKRILDDRA